MKRYVSSQSALKDLGNRLRSYRLQINLTQEELANKSGVSRRSIQYMEDGQEVKLSTLVKVLISLELNQNLDLLIPDNSRRPLSIMDSKLHKKRARTRKEISKPNNKIFKWGDELDG